MKQKDVTLNRSYWVKDWRSIPCSQMSHYKGKWFIIDSFIENKRGEKRFYNSGLGPTYYVKAGDILPAEPMI